MQSLKKTTSGSLNLDEIDFCYQPEINSFTGNIVKLQSIMYFHGYELSCPDFICHFANSSERHVVTVGNHNIQRVCNQIAQWRNSGQTTLPVAVKAYGQQLASEAFLRTVQNSLKQAQLSGNLLEIMFHEKNVCSKHADLKLLLQSLHDLGVTITLSEFGTDLSVFQYIRDLPIDNVIIHKCFINGIGHDKSAEEFIRKMADSLYRLHIKCAASAVESTSQELFLASVGCQIIQSAHAPLSAERIAVLLQGAPR